MGQVGKGVRDTATEACLSSGWASGCTHLGSRAGRHHVLAQARTDLQTLPRGEFRVVQMHRESEVAAKTGPVTDFQPVLSRGPRLASFPECPQLPGLAVGQAGPQRLTVDTEQHFPAQAPPWPPWAPSHGGLAPLGLNVWVDL